MPNDTQPIQVHHDQPAVEDFLCQVTNLLLSPTNKTSVNHTLNMMRSKFTIGSQFITNEKVIEHFVTLLIAQNLAESEISSRLLSIGLDPDEITNYLKYLRKSNTEEM